MSTLDNLILVMVSNILYQMLNTGELLRFAMFAYRAGCVETSNTSKKFPIQFTFYSYFTTFKSCSY